MTTRRLDNRLAFDALARMVVGCPFHRWLGARLIHLDEEAVEIELPWRDEFANEDTNGVAHGGILAALIDLAGDYAVAAKLGRAVPTIDMRADFHRAAPPGPLRARARVVRMGRTLATADAFAYDQAGDLVASGRAVYLVHAR